MFWKKEDEVVTGESIHKQYLKLKGTDSGDGHEKEYLKLRAMIIRNQDVLYDLIFSKKVTDTSELSELIFFGGYGGSVDKDYNWSWIPFLRHVNERITELPPSIQNDFERLRRNHYWDTEEEDTIRRLDEILLTDGKFHYDIAMQKLKKMGLHNDLTAPQYIYLADACDHRNQDGHYLNSEIYTSRSAKRIVFEKHPRRII